MNLEKNLRKEIQKKWKRGRRCQANPPPFRPSERPGLLPPPPLSHARTPASSQPASATWRPYAGEERAAAGHLHPLVGTPARAPRPFHPLCRAPLSLLPPLAQRSRSNSAAAPSPEQLRYSPPATPVPQSRHRNHQRIRHRRGKLLRTFYRGESPSSAVNSSLELLRARRSAPPRRILSFPTSFHSFFGALGR
jgi:hypothetical protein